MSPRVEGWADAPEFCDFALMPGSGVREGYDAAGIDGGIPDPGGTAIAPTGAGDAAA